MNHIVKKFVIIWTTKLNKRKLLKICNITLLKNIYHKTAFQSIWTSMGFWGRLYILLCNEI